MDWTRRRRSSNLDRQAHVSLETVRTILKMMPQDNNTQPCVYTCRPPTPTIPTLTPVMYQIHHCRPSNATTSVPVLLGQFWGPTITSYILLIQDRETYYHREYTKTQPRYKPQVLSLLIHYTSSKSYTSDDGNYLPSAPSRSMPQCYRFIDA